MKKVFVFTLLLVCAGVMAQPGMPNNPVPIDGISTLLLTAGAAIGISKYRKK